VFDKCKWKVVVTANPTVMVDTSVKDYLGGGQGFGNGIKEEDDGDEGFVCGSRLKTPSILIRKVHTESEPPFTGSSLISFVFSVHVYVLACIIDCFEKNEEKRRRKEG